MKYRQLTKEQFEELHKEFAKFLATQQIDASEWKDIKQSKPKVAEEEMNLFSDMVWEGVLTKVNYLEHLSKNTINLFKCNAESIQRIVVTISNPNFDFLNDTDYQWFLNNPKDDTIEYFKGQKNYTGERNSEIFDLIEKGSAISKGDIFEYSHKIINL